eukprot:2042137-Rhodomonas_salina.1
MHPLLPLFPTISLLAVPLTAAPCTSSLPASLQPTLLRVAAGAPKLIELPEADAVVCIFSEVERRYPKVGVGGPGLEPRVVQKCTPVANLAPACQVGWIVDSNQRVAAAAAVDCHGSSLERIVMC